jgi:hypothetical protein
VDQVVWHHNPTVFLSLSSFKGFRRALFLSFLCVSFALSLFLCFQIIVLKDKERGTEKSSTLATLQTSVSEILVRVSSLTTLANLT